MILQRFLFISTLLAWSSASWLHADEQTQLKRKILSDCTSAKVSFEALDATAKEALTPYLARVLELHVTSSLGIQPQLPDSSRALPFLSIESRPHEISIPVDPADEIKAKICALELLGRQGKLAFSALPAMFAMLNKPTTPYQIKQLAAQQSRDIAAAYSSEFTSFSAVDRKALSELPLYLNGYSAFAARAALIELGEHGLAGVIERIPRASEEEIENITELLQSLQTAGVTPATQLYPLLIAGDEAQQVRVIRILVALAPPLEEVLPQLIRLLDDLSGAVRLETRRALKKLIPRDLQPPLVLDVPTQDLLLKIFRIAPTAERREMLDWLPPLINAVQGLEARLLDLFAFQPAEIKRDIISCIADLKTPGAASFAIVQATLKEKDPVIKSEAIRALGRFSHAESQVLKELTSALQALPPTRDSLERESVQRSVAEAVAILHPRSVPPAMLTALLKMLEMRMPTEEDTDHFPFDHDLPAEAQSRFVDHPAVRALVAIGEPARQGVEKIARPGNSDQSRRATAVLGGLSPHPSTISILSTLLGSANHGTRTEAAHALLALGSRIIPLLRKQISSASPVAAVAISEITIRLGEKTLADSKKIYRSLANADCPTRAHGVMLIGDFSESERVEMTPHLTSCLGQNHALDHETIRALTRLAPLPQPELEKIVSMLRSADISPQLRMALLDNARELAIAPSTILPLFQELLKSSTDTVQVRLIRSLGKYGNIDAELTSTLKGMISDDRAQRARSDAAVTALARTAPDSFNFQKWIGDQLEDGERENLTQTLKGFPDDFAEKLLIAALERAEDKEKVGALELLTHLIKPSTTIPVEVSSLLTSTDNALRFAAFRVSAACCPLTAEAFSALKEILFSNEISQMNDLPLNDNTRRALEEIALQSRYLSERISAQRILGLKAQPTPPTH